MEVILNSKDGCRSSGKSIKLWVRNFEVTAITTKKIGGSEKTIRIPENIDCVCEALGRSPWKLAKRYSADLVSAIDQWDGFWRMTYSIIHTRYRKCKIFNLMNTIITYTFVRLCLLLSEGVEIGVHNLCMNDEAHFHLSGYVTKHYFWYWSANYPHALHENPLHSENGA